MRKFAFHLGLCCSILMVLSSDSLAQQQVILDTLNDGVGGFNTPTFVTGNNFASDDAGDFFMTLPSNADGWRIENVTLPIFLTTTESIDNITMLVRFFDDPAPTASDETFINELSNVVWTVGTIDNSTNPGASFFTLELDYLGQGFDFVATGDTIGVAVRILIDGDLDDEERLKVTLSNGTPPIVGTTLVDGYLGDRDGSGNFSFGQDNPNGDFEFIDFGGTPDPETNIALVISATPVVGGGFVSPESFTAFRGVTLAAALADFTESDDASAEFNPGFVLNDLEAPVWLIFDGIAPAATGFSVESNAGTPGLTYTMEAFNWAAGAYDVVGTQAEAFNTDATIEFDIVPADHVDTNGEVRSRVGWRQTGFTINFPWEVRVDQVGWTDQ